MRSESNEGSPIVVIKFISFQFSSPPSKSAPISQNCICSAHFIKYVSDILVSHNAFHTGQRQRKVQNSKHGHLSRTEVISGTNYFYFLFKITQGGGAWCLAAALQGSSVAVVHPGPTVSSAGRHQPRRQPRRHVPKPWKLSICYTSDGR